MKCPNCGKENGIIVKEQRGEKGPVSYFCFECEKDIPLPLENEEWRKTCSTEEFAEWISNFAYACMRCGMTNSKAYCHTKICIQDKKDALMWLKQPHKEE